MLFILSKRGKLTQQELADMLFLEKSSVSRNKLRMLQQELLEKDGRKLFISQKGLTLLNEVIPHWDNAMEEAKQKLGTEGLSSLNSLVNQLIS